MKRIIFFILLLILAACGNGPADSNVEKSQPIPAMESAPQFTPTLPMNVGGENAAAEATSTLVGPTPTETPLPPLELPTPLANPPALLAWDGQPTYMGDSKPGYFFRVKYDPEIWALTTDSYGFPAIGHRGIEYCVIAPASGHGLPVNMKVEHDLRKIGANNFEVNMAYLDGAKQFVTYNGGDANIYTGFEVSFQQEPDLCLQEAEVVLATLISVKESQATPIP